jgi:hypothetical protein
LAKNGSVCHNPNKPKNRINFLKATTIKDFESDRGLWSDVSTQLRNRTMPPVERHFRRLSVVAIPTGFDPLAV